MTSGLSRDLVIFTGAGMSTGDSLYPSWGDLIKSLAKNCKVDDYSKMSYEDAAEEAYKNDREMYEKTILGIFTKRRSNIRITTSDVAKLNCRIFVTTNWDNALETQFKGRVRQTHVFPILNLENAKTPGVHLFHPHGKIEMGDSTLNIILRRSEFEDNYQRKAPVYEFLLTLFSQYDVLFLGFSVSDDYIKKVLRRVVEMEEYRGDQKKARFLLRAMPQVKRYVNRNLKLLLDTDKMRETEREFNSLKISVIWYDPKNDHEEFERIIGLWVEAQAANNTEYGDNNGNLSRN